MSMGIPLDLFINAIIAGLLLGGFYAAVTVGISISFGMLDVVNIAHPAFIILGSYIAYILNTTYGLDPILVAIVTLPAFYLLGALVYQVYYVAFERRGQEALRGLAFFFGLLFITEVALILVFGVDYRSSLRRPTSGRPGASALPIPVTNGPAAAARLVVLLQPALRGPYAHPCRRRDRSRDSASRVQQIVVERIAEQPHVGLRPGAVDDPSEILLGAVRKRDQQAAVREWLGSDDSVGRDREPPGRPHLAEHDATRRCHSMTQHVPRAGVSARNSALSCSVNLSQRAATWVRSPSMAGRQSPVARVTLERWRQTCSRSSGRLSPHWEISGMAASANSGA